MVKKFVNKVGIKRNMFLELKSNFLNMVSVKKKRRNFVKKLGVKRNLL